MAPEWRAPEARLLRAVPRDRARLHLPPAGGGGHLLLLPPRRPQPHRGVQRQQPRADQVRQRQDRGLAGARCDGRHLGMAGHLPRPQQPMGARRLQLRDPVDFADHQQEDHQHRAGEAEVRDVRLSRPLSGERPGRHCDQVAHRIRGGSLRGDRRRRRLCRLRRRDLFHHRQRRGRQQGQGIPADVSRAHGGGLEPDFAGRQAGDATPTASPARRVRCRIGRR